MKKNNYPDGFHTAQAGFTLIEVLVAGIILSVGMLGLAGLQVTSQKLSYGSYLYSQAAFLAYDIADSIRANANDPQAYDIDVSGSCDPNFSSSDNFTPETDAEEWGNRILCTLPGAQASIDLEQKTIADVDSWIATIRIQWDESRMATKSADDDPDLEDISPGRDTFSLVVLI